MSKDVITDELNRLYQFDMDKYLSECTDLKRMGYKIYRNSDGVHKVVEPPSRMQSNVNDFLGCSDFGSIFGQIFGGR